jgi:hypothetical protein
MRAVLSFITDEERHKFGYLQDVKNYMAKFISFDEIKDYDFLASYWSVGLSQGLELMVITDFYEYSYAIICEPDEKLRELRRKYHRGGDKFGNIGYYYFLDGQEIPKVPFSVDPVNWMDFWSKDCGKELIYIGTHNKYDRVWFNLLIYDLGEFLVFKANGHVLFYPKGYFGDEIKFVLDSTLLEYLLPITDVLYEHGLQSLAELLNYYKMRVSLKILCDKI